MDFILHYSRFDHSRSLQTLVTFVIAKLNTQFLFNFVQKTKKYIYFDFYKEDNTASRIYHFGQNWTKVEWLDSPHKKSPEIKVKKLNTENISL